MRMVVLLGALAWIPQHCVQTGTASHLAAGAAGQRAAKRRRPARWLGCELHAAPLWVVDSFTCMAPWSVPA